MLGLTRYGVTYTTTDQTGKATKRTYNGVNFKSDSATEKSNQVLSFFRGDFSYSEGEVVTVVTFPGSLNAIVNALGLTPTAYSIVQENAVTT